MHNSFRGESGMNSYNERFDERSSTSPDSNTQVDHPSPDRRTPSGSPTGSMTNWSSYQSSDYLRQLRDYSFGTAPRLSNSPSTYPIASQDDTELEELMLRTDITPRPSVVAYNYQSSPRTSTCHHSSRGPVGQGAQHISTGRQNWGSRDQEGTNVNSTPSSASTSVTSFNESLYTGSAVSVDSSSAPQTPSNDFTSSEDDDERRRPYHANSSGPYPNPSANTSTTSMEFSSEEEYESDDIPEIEISSMRAASVDMSFQQEEEYTDVEAYYLQGRRGSLPMDIPGALATPGINTQYSFNRDRDDSLNNLRRPSRSLDDDLHVVETMRSSGVGSRARSDDPVLSSPISVPESESDWRNLNARTRQRGNTQSDGGGIPEDFEFPSTNSRSNQVLATGTHDDFDTDWDNLRQGIVSFDRSQLEDIVRQPGTDGGRTATGPRWFPRFGGGNSQSPAHARRQSVTTVTSLSNDTFGRAVSGWGGEGYKAQRKDWTFKREKITGIGQQAPAAYASGNAGSRSLTGLLSSKTSEDNKKALKERAKEKERLARVAASWKGMPLDSQEMWKMDLIGTFRVERKATKTADLAKGPQQRIIVHHLRGVDNNVASMIGGPMSTIHKHSKAVAFSIGRFYRKKNESKERIRETGGGPLLTASHPPAPSHDSQKRPGGMILLAPRRVQVAFTNTTSTRKLESHGLLDEDRSSKGLKEYEFRGDKESERDKKKGKERNKKREREKDKQKLPQRQEELKGKGRALGTFQETRYVDVVNFSDTSRFTNASSGSDSYQTPSVITSSTIVAPSVALTPLSSSVDFNMQHTDTDTASRSITANLQVTNRTRRRRRRIHDPLEMYEDEDEYDYETGRHSPPTTTPHSETYGTVDASLIEQLNIERAQQELETGSVFKRLFRGRNNRATVGPATGQLEANYDPPWIVLPSRSKQEQQQRVVENLNSSFMDVGLLPSNHKMKKRSGSAPRKKREEQPNGILSEVPEESLYMLLPLWPSETDPISIQDHLHLLKRIPPTDRRQYVLIYYRSIGSRKKGDRKNRSLPAIDADRTDRSVLLASFHISARFVAHNELIGTGIRVPDEGLRISGPLDYAWETLPSAEAREECKSDWVIGICNSRESGVEFIPEGLVKMDLCRASWKSPNAVNDDFVPPEPTFHMTPIGRSVVEMAWLGAIALTSFGQLGQV